MRTFVVAMVLTSLCALSLRAEELCELSGRFVLDGSLPKPRTFHHPRLKTEMDDESLLVDLQTHGIANIVVQIYTKRGEKPPPAVDPEQPFEEVTLQAGAVRFSPRIVLLRTGQKLVVTNRDEVGHNVKANLLANTPFNVLLERGAESTFVFPRSEKVPAEVSSVAPWLHGYLLVTEHPYVAVSDVSGRFVIRNLPPGEWTFLAWHETSGFIERVERDGEQQKWLKGRFTVDVKPGENDLGWISVSSDEFPRD